MIERTCHFILRPAETSYHQEEPLLVVTLPTADQASSSSPLALPVAPPRRHGFPVNQLWAQAGQPQAASELDLSEILQIYREGRPDEAEQALRAFVKRHPGHEEARKIIASWLLEAGRRDEAITVARQAVADYPTQPHWAFILFALLFGNKDFSGAIAVLEKAKGLYPPELSVAERDEYQVSIDVYLALGHSGNGNEEKALEFLEGVIYQYPEIAKLHFGQLGIILSSYPPVVQDVILHELIKVLAGFVESHPEVPMTHRWLAGYYGQQKRFHDEFRAAHRYVQLHSKDPYAHLALGTSYEHHKRFDKAEAAYREVLRLVGNKEDRQSIRFLFLAYHLLAVLNFREKKNLALAWGNLLKARQYHETEWRRWGGDGPLVRAQLDHLAEQIGTEWIDVLREQLEQKPGDGVGWKKLGELYEAVDDSGRYSDEALEAYLKAQHLGPEDRALGFVIGRLLIGKGEFNKARPYLEVYQQQLPRDVEALFYLGVAYCFDKGRNPERATDLLQRYLAKAPEGAANRGKAEGLLKQLATP